MDEDLPIEKPVYRIGQDTSLMSAEELRETIDILKADIARLEREIEHKSASRNAAEAFFKA